MEGRGPWSRIVCCGLAVGGLGRVCRGRRGVGSLVGGRLSSWSLAWGEWLGEHGECSADRFVGFGDRDGHVFGDGYVVVGAGCAFGVPCVGVGPLHGGGAGCACRVVHGGKGLPLEPACWGGGGRGSRGVRFAYRRCRTRAWMQWPVWVFWLLWDRSVHPRCVSALGVTTTRLHGGIASVRGRRFEASRTRGRNCPSFSLRHTTCARCVLSLLLTGASAS